MKRFIISGFLFLCVSFTIAYLVDIIITKNIWHTQAREFKAWNDIYASNEYHNLVINGSSRAWVQYSPIILDSVLQINSFNLGIDGSNINRQIIKYHAYCRKHGIPQYVIQNIDLITIAITLNYQKEQFPPYFSIDHQLMNDISAYEDYSFVEKHIPFVRYCGYNSIILKLGLHLCDGVDESFDGPLYKGFSCNTDSWNGASFEKQNTIQYEHDSTALRLFDEYLAELKRDGVKTIFVYAPLYSGATAKIENIKGMYEMYDSFAVKYNIPILDYNYWALCSDTSCFYNAMHLNKKGAELFSLKLAHDLDSLGIIKRRR